MADFRDGRVRRFVVYSSETVGYYQDFEVELLYDWEPFFHPTCFETLQDKCLWSLKGIIPLDMRGAFRRTAIPLDKDWFHLIFRLYEDGSVRILSIVNYTEESLAGPLGLCSRGVTLVLDKEQCLRLWFF